MSGFRRAGAHVVVAVVVGLLLAPGGASSQSAATRSPGKAGASPGAQGTAQAMDTTWAAWRLVLGDWTAEEGGGAPGAASGGGESFRRALDGRILERRHWSAYPATASRPAFRNEGLMIVYPERGSYRAIAFDNEGHVIRYAATAADSAVVLVSDAVAGEPRFRLSYRPEPGGRIGIRFEMAPPGQPEAFRTYVEGRAHRR